MIGTEGELRGEAMRATSLYQITWVCFRAHVTLPQEISHENDHTLSLRRKRIPYLASSSG